MMVLGESATSAYKNHSHPRHMGRQSRDLKHFVNYMRGQVLRPSEVKHMGYRYPWLLRRPVKREDIERLPPYSPVQSPNSYPFQQWENPQQQPMEYYMAQRYQDPNNPGLMYPPMQPPVMSHWLPPNRSNFPYPLYGPKWNLPPQYSLTQTEPLMEMDRNKLEPPLVDDTMAETFSWPPPPYGSVLPRPMWGSNGNIPPQYPFSQVEFPSGMDRSRYEKQPPFMEAQSQISLSYSSSDSAENVYSSSEIPANVEPSMVEIDIKSSPNSETEDSETKPASNVGEYSASPSSKKKCKTRKVKISTVNPKSTSEGANEKEETPLVKTTTEKGEADKPGPEAVYNSLINVFNHTVKSLNKNEIIDKLIRFTPTERNILDYLKVFSSAMNAFLDGEGTKTGKTTGRSVAKTTSRTSKTSFKTNQDSEEALRSYLNRQWSARKVGKVLISKPPLTTDHYKYKKTGTKRHVTRMPSTTLKPSSVSSIHTIGTETLITTALGGYKTASPKASICNEVDVPLVNSSLLTKKTVSTEYNPVSQKNRNDSCVEMQSSHSDWNSNMSEFPKPFTNTSSRLGFEDSLLSKILIGLNLGKATNPQYHFPLLELSSGLDQSRSKQQPSLIESQSVTTFWHSSSESPANVKASRIVKNGTVNPKSASEGVNDKKEPCLVRTTTEKGESGKLGLELLYNSLRKNANIPLIQDASSKEEGKQVAKMALKDIEREIGDWIVSFMEKTVSTTKFSTPYDSEIAPKVLPECKVPRSLLLTSKQPSSPPGTHDDLLMSLVSKLVLANEKKRAQTATSTVRVIETASKISIEKSKKCEDIDLISEGVEKLTKLLKQSVDKFRKEETGTVEARKFKGFSTSINSTETKNESSNVNRAYSLTEKGLFSLDKMKLLTSSKLKELLKDTRLMSKGMATAGSTSTTQGTERGAETRTKSKTGTGGISAFLELLNRPRSDSTKGVGPCKSIALTLSSYSLQPSRDKPGKFILSCLCKNASSLRRSVTETLNAARKAGNTSQCKTQERTGVMICPYCEKVVSLTAGENPEKGEPLLKAMTSLTALYKKIQDTPPLVRANCAVCSTLATACPTEPSSTTGCSTTPSCKTSTATTCKQSTVSSCVSKLHDKTRSLSLGDLLKFELQHLYPNELRAPPDVNRDT